MKQFEAAGCHRQLRRIAKRTLAAVVAAMAAAGLAGCESFYMANLSETVSGAARAAADVVADGYRTVEGWETDSIASIRKGNFAQERGEKLSMRVEAKSLYLRAAANGTGFTDHSIASANRFLLSQGPIGRQVLTIVPLSENGEKLARRLAEALEEAGAQTPKLGRYVREDGSARDFADRRTGWDIELISEAYVVDAPDCLVRDPKRWTVDPYYAVGTLGCANNANIAVMTSDPKDLLRPRSLDAADGVSSANAVGKYQEGETEELVDIDFSQEE